MVNLTAGSYERHRDCTVGQTVIATLDDGRTVSGTVMDNIGATVYVAADEGGMYEMRRVTDSSSGQQAIMLGIDGKEVTDHEPEYTQNDLGYVERRESSTLSFDHRVVDFEAETQEIVLGEVEEPTDE